MTLLPRGLAFLSCSVAACCMISAQTADTKSTAPIVPAAPQARPARTPPPTRAPDGPGAPTFTVAGAKPGQTELRAAPGANPPADTNGDFLVGPDYVPAPELKAVEGVPQGKIHQFQMDSAESKFYPGIARVAPGKPDPNNPKTLIIQTQPAPYKRTITVYVPAQYKTGTAAPFIVTHDGPGMGKSDQTLTTVLDNLIAQHRLPTLIAIMVANGGGDGQGSERGLEYDTMSGKYAEFIEAEVLPLVEHNAGVTLSKDPEGRGSMGGSSGGAAAFIMAWYHPEWYRRVITYSGTYVNQQWPFNAETPGGAWDFHTKLIAESAPKPIRLWMQVGDRDNFGRSGDGMHDWVAANHRMAAMLKTKGYAYQYIFSLNAGHVDHSVREQTLPEALEWVWRGFPVVH